MGAKYKIHPAAARWPVGPEAKLRRLADSIREIGQLHPIYRTPDPDGEIVSGQRRLLACEIAGVEPRIEVHHGDPAKIILGENLEQRDASLPEKAAAAALSLGDLGCRIATENGGMRWKRGSVPEVPGDNGRSSSNAWIKAMTQAGFVLDHASDLLVRVLDETDKMTLNSAVEEAQERKQQAEQRGTLPDDLGALVDAGELSIEDALRRAKLSDRYAALVASGNLELDEAEHLNERDEREYRESIHHIKNMILSFLHGWDAASHLRRDANRDAVLDALSTFDRERFLSIESGGFNANQPAES